MRLNQRLGSLLTHRPRRSRSRRLPFWSRFEHQHLAFVLVGQGAGDLVAVSATGPAVSSIDFSLSLSLESIFADGFESGDTSAWTTPVP